MALPTGSDNKFPKIIITEGAAPSSPSAGDQKVYIDSADHHVKRKNSAGTVVDLEKLGGTEVDYAQLTSATTNITATTEATANTIVTGNAVTYDGSTVVMIEFFAPGVVPDAGAAGRSVLLWLYDGSSSIGALGGVVTPAASGMQTIVHCFRRLTPSAASHTYSVRGSVSAGTGVIDAGAGGAGAYVPAFIRITRV